MATLETQLDNEFNLLGIDEKNRISVCSFLALIRLKDKPTYMHSIRVGLLGSKIARENPSMDPRALFFPGLLHDIGKITVDPSVLKKTKDFGEADMEKMRSHCVSSYQILRGVHDFSAEVALRHHYFQKNGYPKDLPELHTSFSRATETLINYYARILALADSYDAASSRANNKFGNECRYLTSEEVRNFMFRENPDQKRLLEHLYNKHIFGDRDCSESRPDSHGYAPMHGLQLLKPE
jgi:response regulator RpfG family c-di-GMP phosphodiesterase